MPNAAEPVVPIQNPESSAVSSGGSFAGDAITLAGGATVAQIIGFLAAPILSRLFAPEAFGTAAVFTSIVSIVTVVACLRYELAIMLPKKDKNAANLLVGSLLFVGAFTILTALSALFLGEQVATWLNAPELEPFLWMLPIAVLSNGSYLALRYWNTRARRFGLLSGQRIASVAGQTTFKLGSGALGFVEAGPLIISRVLGYMIPSLGLGWTAWRHDRQLLSQVRWVRITRLFKRYRKFPLVSTWSALLNSFSLQLPIWLLSAFFSQTTVGYYSFGMRMIGLPITLVGQAVSQVFYQRASEALNQGTLHRVVQVTFANLVSLGLFPMLAIGLIGPELFVVVFGPEWAEAGIYAQILSLWRFVGFVSSPISTVASVIERQEVGLTFNIILVAARIITLAIGGWLGNARLALALYAACGFIAFTWFTLWILRESGASIRQAIRAVIGSLAYASPALLFLAAAKWLWNWPNPIIVVTAGLGGLVYYSITIHQDRSLLEPLQNITRRFWKRSV